MSTGPANPTPAPDYRDAATMLVDPEDVIVEEEDYIESGFVPYDAPAESHPYDEYGGEYDDEYDEPMLKAGDMLAMRYRIIRRLGMGGMGDVYLAEHIDIEREVAIKVLVLDPETAKRRKSRSAAIERFMQEARAASRIRHKNIVDITDVECRRRTATSEWGRKTVYGTTRATARVTVHVGERDTLVASRRYP